MRLLGGVLLVLSLIKGTILSMHIMDVVDLEFGPHEATASIIDLFITLVLSGWCLFGRVAAWKYSMWYLVGIAVYSVIYELVTVKVWNDAFVLGLALLVIIYGFIVFAFSRRTFLSCVAIDNVPRALDVFVFVSVFGGILIVLGYFFSWVVAAVTVTLILIATKNTKALS